MTKLSSGSSKVSRYSRLAFSSSASAVPRSQESPYETPTAMCPVRALEGLSRSMRKVRRFLGQGLIQAKQFF